MKIVHEFLCDGNVPSDKEIEECITLVKLTDSVIKLRWYFPYSGWHERYIKKDMTFEEVKNSLPRVYDV